MQKSILVLTETLAPAPHCYDQILRFTFIGPSMKPTSPYGLIIAQLEGFPAYFPCLKTVLLSQSLSCWEYLHYE